MFKEVYPKNYSEVEWKKKIAIHLHYCDYNLNWLCPIGVWNEYWLYLSCDYFVFSLWSEGNILVKSDSSYSPNVLPTFNLRDSYFVIFYFMNLYLIDNIIIRSKQNIYFWICFSNKYQNNSDLLTYFPKFK